MGKTKRILSFLIALIMVLALVPFNAIVYAVDVETGDEAQTQAPSNEKANEDLPSASVSRLPTETIKEFTIFDKFAGGADDFAEILNPQVLMQFVAKDTAESAANSAYAKYIADFYITVDGLSQATYGKGCYLVGHYEGYGWYAVPLDGIEVENAKYPVMSSIAAKLTYEQICTSVKDFKCGIYFAPEFIEANPNMKVSLELGLSETFEQAEKAEFTRIGDAYTYTVEDLTSDAPVFIPDELTGTVVDEIKNNTSLDEYTPVNVPEGAELVIELVSVDGKIVYDVTPMANGAKVEELAKAITFRLPVPASTAYAHANVYHDGVLMGTYEILGEGNGKYVEISSDDFSEFAVEPIEKVVEKNIAVIDAEGNVTYYAGFTGFKDLNLANCTIKLLNNVSDANLLLYADDVNVVLDLNGFTFTRIGSSSGAISLSSGPSLTIKDTSDAKTGKIIVDTYAVWVMNGDLTIEGGTIETTSAKNAALYLNASETVISGGKIISAGNAITVGENFMESRGTSNVAISGGEIEAAGNIIVKGRYAQEESKAVVTGGTFSKDVSDYCADGFECKANADGTFGIEEKKTYVAMIGENGYETLEAAIAAAQNDDTIVLINNVDINSIIKILAGQEIVLDLNGYTVDGVEKVRIAIMSYGDLTIKDSSAEKTGTIKAGIGTAGNAIDICAGTFVFESGNIYSKNNAILIDEQAATVTIKGGKITAEPATNNSAAFYISSTSETVLNIEGGEMVGFNGILLWNNTTINMSAGTIDAQGRLGIQGNGSKDNTEINISGTASVTGKDAAIYHPQGGDLNISGNAVLTGDTGVIIKGGNVTISGGTINGIGAAAEYVPQNSGYNGTGDGLYVENYDNSPNSENYGPVTVTVTGGTFNSTNAKAVASYANPNADVSAPSGFISGGTFNTPVDAELCAEGFVPCDNGDGTYGVIEATYVAQIGDKKYTSLQDAIDAAQNGETVVLLADIADSATIKIAGKSITLDLNGKAINGVCNAGQSSLVYIENNASLTVKDSVGTGKIAYAQGTSNVGWTIDVKGEFVLESGTIELTGSWSIGYAVDVRPNSWGTEYTNPSVFVMNGGTILSSDGAVRVASSSSDAHKMVSASFVLNDGRISAAWDGVFIQQSDVIYDDLSFTMNGGVIESALNPVRVYGPAPTSYVNGQNCMSITLAGGTMTYTGAEAQTWVIEGILRVGGGSSIETILENGTIAVSGAIVEATAAPEGYQWVDNGDGTYGVEKKPALIQVMLGNTVLVEESLTIRYYVDSTKLDANKSYYAVITFNGVETEAVKLTSDMFGKGSYAKCYLVNVSGITAKQMGEIANVVVYEGEDTTDRSNRVSVDYPASIKSYATGMFAYTKNEQLKKLLIDMLYYGAAAQVQFNYNTDALVTDGLTDAQKAYASTAITNGWNGSAYTASGEVSQYFQGSTASLKDKVELNFRFINLAGIRDKVTFKISYVNYRGETISYEQSGADATLAGSVLVVAVPLVAADMRTVVTCELYIDGNAAPTVTATQSVEAYCYLMSGGNIDSIYGSIIKYSDSAKKYLNK